MLKIGDRVKVVKKEHGQTKAKIGMFGEIVRGVTNFWEVYIKEINCHYRFLEEELELALFTKSDLKDNHIVVQRNEYVALWKTKNKTAFENDLKCSIEEEFDIVEVWEFDKLVWKREEQILDEAEKKYLSDVIRPFRDRVKYIEKREHCRKIWQDIVILIKDNKGSLYFPEFEPNTMYKGMEVGKEYSLEDLGL